MHKVGDRIFWEPHNEYVTVIEVDTELGKQIYRVSRDNGVKFYIRPEGN